MTRSDETEVIERLVRVETRIDGIDARLKPIAATLTEVADNHRAQRGFMSGVMWVISTVWVFVGGIIAVTWGYFNSGGGS